jgi:undecaprenyl-diphosphatase
VTAVQSTAGPLVRVAVRGSTAAQRAWARRRDPQAQWLAALVFVFLGASAAFADVVEDYLTGDPIVRWDVEFARWLHEHSSPWLVDLFEVVTVAGSAVVLALVVAAVIVMLLRRRLAAEAVLLTAVSVGIGALNGGLKLAFHRPRPELAFVHLDTYSFPSGHAAGSAAIYATIAYLAAQRLRPCGQVLVAAATTVLVLTIAFSRLYLGAHYLSDVLAGLSLGTAWAAGWLLAYELVSGRGLSGRVSSRAPTTPR